MNEEEVDSILTYWFTNKNDPADQWNATLWFYGGAEVDSYIAQNFAPLFESVAKTLRLRDDTLDGNVSSSVSTKSKIATIILLDQFPRHVFRGSNGMFQFDDLASVLAKEVLQDQEVPFETLPWTHRLFVLICLTHTEEELHVNEAAIGMSALAAHLHHDAEMYAPVLVTRVKRMFKHTESRLAVIKR